MIVFQHLTSTQKQELWRLYSKGIPNMLLQLVALLFISGLLDGPGVDGVEFFAGMQSVTQLRIQIDLYHLPCVCVL